MYILILTMIFISGYGGMGGVVVHEFDSAEKCNAVGTAWIVQMKDRRKTGDNEAFYQCLKL